jgi:hypothetical protein
VCARARYDSAVLGPRLRPRTSLYIFTENIQLDTVALYHLAGPLDVHLLCGSRRSLSPAAFARWVRVHARPDAAFCSPSRLRPLL